MKKPGGGDSRVYGTGGHSVALLQARLWILVSSLALNVVFALLIAFCGEVLRDRHEHGGCWRWGFIARTHIAQTSAMPWLAP